MDIQNTSHSVFEPISSSFAAKVYCQKVIYQTPLQESFGSNQLIILSLTKTHVLVSSANTLKQDIFAAEITFDLKFQVIYEQEKNVKSKKLGIKFSHSTNQTKSFFSSEQFIIQRWVQYLSKAINQKGFHQLFKPIKKLGKGNFASVYQVERVTDLRRFAVKAFSKVNTFSAKNGKESLINQLTVMRSLNHQNILTLEGIFQSDNSIYVILEVLHGQQLFHKIQKSKGSFSKEQIKIFMRGLLKGLAHMHERRVMHRDLKPENIMLRNPFSMDPVIVDFGLATNADVQQYLFYRCGTPGYVAPQIVRLTENSHIEPQCDVFSAGVIFHILLMKRPLFEGTKYDQVYRNNKQMKFNLDAQIYSKLQKQQLSLLKKMLVQNPDYRITAQQALKHPYFEQEDNFLFQKQISSPQMTTVSQNQRPIKNKKLIRF